MKESLSNTIEIACTPEKLFGYVTQPWLWHQWHPNSKSAQAKNKLLKKGDSFDEVIEIQPLSPLPFKMRRNTQYQVIAATANTHWCVEGKMSGGFLKINYEFVASKVGVIFTRTLTYEVTGVSQIIFPFLKPRMREMSLLALTNLKSKIEAF